MNRQWDVAVIGAGAAGLTAAETIARAGLSCVLIDRMGAGGVLMNLGALHDCPSLPEGTTGPDFAAQLLDAAMAAGAELAVGEAASLVGGPPWSIATDDETHEARALVIATGLTPGHLGVPDESAYEGRGVAHCAACDGPLYVGQPVMVAGSDKWALQDAIDLAAIAAHVTLVGRSDVVAADRRAARLAGLANVTLRTGPVTALHGTDGMEAVSVAHDGATERVEARAVFVHTDRRGSTAFAGDALALDAAGRIEADGTTATTTPSIFAAGDVRSGSAELLADAIDEGRRAGEAAVRHVRSSGAA
jgi:thioredoxin reductase (NADPH)